MTTESVVGADLGLSDTPLVSVSFQKNEKRVEKFLESEPKALGITQLCLSLFHISCMTALSASDAGSRLFGILVAQIVPSIFICAAASLTIQARHLKLSVIRACLGMEIVASLSSAINIIILAILTSYRSCDYRYYRYDELQMKMNCKITENAFKHLCAELLLIHVALFAISVTLVIYACKVANCCSIAPKVPVITLQMPPASQ